MKPLCHLFQRRVVSAITIFSILFFESCKKEPDYYIKCKVDGKDFVSETCELCMTASLWDTAFNMSGHAGRFDAVRLSVISKPSFTMQTYILDGNERSGFYSNAPVGPFVTDSLRTGNLTITTLDKTNRIIAGTFYFEAFNALLRQVVTITDGQFRLQY